VRLSKPHWRLLSIIAMSARSAIVLQQVKKAFPLRGGLDLEVLDLEHLALPVGSCTILRGRSGSGKTTLLNLIAGVIVPTAGTVCVGGTDVFALSEAQRDRFRAAHVGYVFQTFNLLAALSALENVMLAMMFAGTVPQRLQRRHATDLLARLGLAERVAHRPAQLSRGEQQRVAIARALANGPPLILADEPCASLDARTASEVLAILLAVCRQDQKTLLLASHDEAALEGADRVVEMAEVNRTAVRRALG
jgi:ABC-type lipoprotein export system ATPase subunit